MALPKKVKKDINIAPQALQPRYPYGYNGITTPIRRKELADYITEDGTFLPKSVLHEDMDGGMLDFVKSQLGVTISGKKINIIDRILTLQRLGEFANTWTFANEDRNVELPFIVVVRKPDVQYGSNPSLQYTIPDRKQFHFAKVPTWDGVRKGMDVYTIPQPVPVDITYDVKNNVPNQLLRNLAKMLGWKTPSTTTKEQFLDTVLDKYEPQYSGESIGVTPAELDIEIYRIILMNTSYLFKSKGTRKAIEFLLKFIGAPEALIEFNEYVVLADARIKMGDRKSVV